MLKRLRLKKDYILIAGSLFLLLLGYHLAFSNTIDAWKINRELKSKIAETASVTYQPVYLERKINNLNHILDHYRADTTELRGDLLNTISSVAEKNDVKLAEVPQQDPDFQTNDFKVERLRFEGDYFSLAKALNGLEKTANIGIIRSVSFRIIGSKYANEGDKRLTLDISLEILK